MSASLVGSEMCIRDSPNRGLGSRRQTVTWRVNTPPSLGFAFARRGTVAVSYTHLTLPTICSV
eukprot:4396660-Alexandrium_andersonii.AAC.1